MSNNNTQAVKFCNESIRVAADKLAQSYFANQVLDEWYARNLGSVIPVDCGEIEDGAAVDGRPVITGNEVHLMMSRISEIVADYEASNNAKLNTILQVSPNQKG